MRALAAVALALIGCSSEERAAPVPTPDATGVDAARPDAYAGDSFAGPEVTDPDTGPSDTRFASYPPWPDADVDAWLKGPDDAGSCEDAAIDAEPGTRFCELYRDVFAHTGAAGCQTYGCHGGEHGAQGLALGWNARSMYDAMAAFKTWVAPGKLLTPVPGGDSRPTSALSSALGPKNGYFMPFVVDELGNRKLTDAEVARIEAWLARGAPFD